MAQKRITKYWEENKPVYPLCLCYSKEEGLCMKRFSDNVTTNELLYRPHGYKGGIKDTIEIPNQNITIEFQSNFGFGKASFHRAYMKRVNRPISFFDLSKLYVLHNMGLNTIEVRLFDWDKLFEKMIYAYASSLTRRCTTDSIVYIEELSKMLDKEQIVFTNNYNDEKKIEWEGEYLVSLYVSTKIRDLLIGIEESQIDDPIVMKYILDLCRKYIGKVKSLEWDYNDSRLSRFSETLMLIHRFMCTNNAGIEYLRLMFEKEPSSPTIF